jgi:hypothetical protein
VGTGADAVSTCKSNTRTGRIGCGATYSGEMQHMVERVSWSEHPDGRAHITGRLSTIERLRSGKTKREPSNPADDEKLYRDERGVWRQVAPEGTWTR